MPTIQHIRIKHYKNLYDIDLELKPLNVMIGDNGAGKSNFLNFFRLLKEGAEGNLRNRILSLGGFSMLRSTDADDYDMVEWELTFDGFDRTRAEAVHYAGKMAAKGSTYTLKWEDLYRPPYSDHTSPYYFLSAIEGRIRYLTENPSSGDENLGNEEGPKNETANMYDDQELIITQIRDRIRYPLLDQMRRTLNDWTIFRGFGENALQEIRKPQQLQVLNPLRLDPDGHNLASFIYTLREDAAYDAIYDQLLDFLGTAFPDFKRLDMPVSASGIIQLNWRNQSGTAFPTLALSDGMMRFLGLVALLLTPNPPALIAIDEPEIGLHPNLLPLLGELMQDAAQRTQLIVATHSPLLLNSLQPDQVILVERDAEFKTLMRRADDLAHLNRWLDHYTLGSLWTMNKLTTD